MLVEAVTLSWYIGAAKFFYGVTVKQSKKVDFKVLLHVDETKVVEVRNAFSACNGWQRYFIGISPTWTCSIAIINKCVYTTDKTMSVVFIVGLICTLAASHAAFDKSHWVKTTTGQADRRTDGWTPDRYITLSVKLTRCKTERHNQHAKRRCINRHISLDCSTGSYVSS